MPTWQHYHIARSTDDALRALGDAVGSTRIIAGGTDFLLDIQQGRHEEIHTLVDVNDIPDMRVLEIRGSELFIGASVPHKIITQSALVREHGEALATASGLIGGPQVRNTATIGGNVAHALPAADGTIALMSLDARAEITSGRGRKLVLMKDLFQGPGKNTLNQKTEILTGFSFFLRKKGQASAFNRIMRPQGVAIAILNLSVWIERQGDTIADVRIAIGPSGPIPRRIMLAENSLKGKPLTDSTIAEAGKAALEDVQVRTSRHRSTKEYREDMVGVLLEKTLNEAWERAGRSV